MSQYLSAITLDNGAVVGGVFQPIQSLDVTGALGYTPPAPGTFVNSFNGRTGAVTLQIGDTVANGTPGNFLFVDNSGLVGQNKNCFWDNTNLRVGLGTQTPADRLHLASGGIEMDVLTPATPSVALAGLGAGNVDTGSHRYATTYTNATGESALGSSVAVTTSAGNGQVNVTVAASSDPTVTAIKIYRTLAGTSLPFYLVTSLSNTAQTYLDNLSDATVTANGLTPNVNYTGCVIKRGSSIVLAFSGTNTVLLGGNAASNVFVVGGVNREGTGTRIVSAIIRPPNIGSGNANIMGGSLIFQDGAGTGTGGGGGINFATNSPGSSGTTPNTAITALSIDNSQNVTANAGQLIIGTSGKGLSIKTGSNAKMGTGTLSGGTATISTTAVTANSLIFLSDQGGGVLANIGSLSVGTVTVGTSFVVNSSNALDSSNFAWLIIEQT